MKSLARQLFRSAARVLVVLILLEASPLPALAAVPRAPDVSSVVAQLKSDLTRLEQGGKEAYLDDLYARLDRDEARAADHVRTGVKRIGAKRLCMMVAAIGSPVLAAVLAVIPQSWEEKLVVSALTRFVHKALREVREHLARVDARTLARGLKAILALLGNPSAAPHALAGDPGQTWWERFFSNSTAVRNFIVTIVALSAIGVAVGLAIAGSTAAPVVAVVGALVSLIALIIPGPGDHGFTPLAD